jgi:hypothetical protein
MKTKVVVTVICLILGFPARRLNSQSQENASTAKLMHQILELRADLLQLLITEQQNSLRILQRDLEQARRQQQNVNAAEQSRSEQVVQLEQQLASPDLENEVRPEVEAIKKQLSSEGAEKLQTDASSARQREADLNAQLEAGVRQLRILQQRVEQVQKALAQ